MDRLVSWDRVWTGENGVVAEISTGPYGGTIRIGEPYADAPPDDDPDDTLGSVTFWTFDDVRDLLRTLETVLPWQP